MSTALSTGHVGINVSDLDRSIGFYTDVLTLDVLERHDDDGRRYAYLGTEEVLLLTLWQQASGSFDADLAGLHHLAFLVPDVDAVTAVESRVLGAGGTLVHDRLVAHDEGRASGGVFFRDPDGTRLEVYTNSGLEGTAPASDDGPACGFF
ncbi:Biphenyl-2,3-diol 1,2-dioxygenase [Euzebya pacifica]|uniref:Biphenyl-2,3-diol 1,2-dioxygenase n=1 Tax=Euzebya pacifica TaxID=1608957 RepID=A0A346XTP3_9ACTN|nr:VOC family protein [Euzebya pacifica]AXV05590.1 Biphenyl-2,3-diol 1,2-dioxygenase [Euzebya pacifica]